MKYSERDLLVIYNAILDDDYNKINDNYKILSRSFDSLKILIKAYHNERREEKSRSVMLQDLAYLINTIEALQYIRRPLTDDDYDTIKVLLNISYEKVRFNISFLKFKSLLLLIFHDTNCRDKKFLDSLIVAIDCFKENYCNVNLDGLNLSNKIYELYNLSILIELNPADGFRYFIICKLAIYGCLNNNFEYLHNFLNNSSYYLEYLEHNGFFNHNMSQLIYQNIEKVFVKTSSIKE